MKRIGDQEENVSTSGGEACVVNGDQRPVTPSSKHQKKDDQETQKWYTKRVKDEERQKERRGGRGRTWKGDSAAIRVPLVS